MSEYHPYVFDEQRRRFVGKFEEMYQAETEKGFDSWCQDDVRHIERHICLNILGRYNFNRILDVGCGKGAFSQFLKKQNNHVLGIDISETALAVATARYPDIEFRQVDVKSDDWVETISWGGGFGGLSGDFVVYRELASASPNLRKDCKVHFDSTLCP